MFHVSDALGADPFSEAAKGGGMHEGHELSVWDIAEILHVAVFLNRFNDLSIA